MELSNDLGRPLATLIFLYCGQGDTILIGHDGHWGLIDCNLTKCSGADRRIRQVIEDHGIDSLDFVCLTHPDRDHFFGLKELLQEKFFDAAADRLKFAEFWDAGIFSSLLLALDKMLGRGEPFVAKGIDDLYSEFILRLRGQGKIGLQTAQRGFSIPFGDFRLEVLSPTRNSVDTFNERMAEQLSGQEIEWCKGLRKTKNDLSVVLAMSHVRVPVTFLFGSDATRTAWPGALAQWQQLTASRSGPASRTFAGVKVSHHGVPSGHYPELYEQFCVPGESLAVLTVGDDYDKHPDPNVLADLAGSGMQVYATCWPERPGVKPTSDRLPLPGESAEAASTYPTFDGFGCYDVTVEIWPSGKATAKPRQSLLKLACGKRKT